MRKTRNLFILLGTAQNVAQVIHKLQFKGTTIMEDSISNSCIHEVYKNNKSIICTSEHAGFEKFHESPIYIEVVNNSKPIFQNYIDISKGDIIGQFQNIAIRHNCDIGDHKTNSSGLNGAPTSKDCAYCKILKNMESIPERRVYQSNNFFVIPTLGEFIKGYLLIVPINHIMSMAELNNSSIKEFKEVMQDIEYILNLTYSTTKFLVWENGTGNLGIGKAKDSIVHAHTHIAPSNLTINQIKNMSRFNFTKISLDNLNEYSNDSYLLIRDDNTQDWWINNNSKLYIPRQYIRQLLASEYNIQEEDAWNWRTHPFRELMEQTVNDIIYAVKSNWKKIPSRIKQNTENCID